MKNNMMKIVYFAIFFAHLSLYTNAQENMYYLSFSNDGMISTKSSEKKKFATLDRVHQCIMKLDFSQMVVMAEVKNSPEVPKIQIQTINFTQGKMDDNMELKVRIPRRYYIDKECGDEHWLPKVSARVTYRAEEGKKDKLIISANDIPNKRGETDDESPFFIVLILSYTDDFHATAEGSLSIGDYKATISHINIILKKNRSMK